MFTNLQELIDKRNQFYSNSKKRKQLLDSIIEVIGEIIIEMNEEIIYVYNDNGFHKAKHNCIEAYWVLGYFPDWAEFGPARITQYNLPFIVKAIDVKIARQIKKLDEAIELDKKLENYNVS